MVKRLVMALKDASIRFNEKSEFYVEQDVALKDKNWFCTGGPAKFFCQPKTEKDFVQAIEFANERVLEIAVLGLGANILVSDEGFNGLLIRPMLDKIEILDDGSICAGAGVEIQTLINFCLDHNRFGLEEFSGIPGTVGGAIFINIHYLTHFLSDLVCTARVIDKISGQIVDVNKSWFKFGYDSSRLFERTHFLVSATFNVRKGTHLEGAYCKGRRDEIIRHRNMRYPTSNTCGSFFRNFHENEVNFLINGKKILSVAYYLDKLGIKGELTHGCAVVSHQHANMIVSKYGATSFDIVTLAKKMQYMVKEKFGILPQAECQTIGFKNEPFL